MTFDPAANYTLANSLEAQAEQRAREEDSAALDEKYSDPAVLEGQQDELLQQLYPKGHICTPEEREHNSEQFILRYAADLELLLNSEVAMSIWKEYEKNWDIEAAVFIVVANMDTPLGWMSVKLENVEEAVEQIADYLDPRLTSTRINKKLQSEDWITVESWMNASYIPALSGSNRTFSLNDNASSLNIWDTLSYSGDSTTLMKNDTQIWELDTPDEWIPELLWTEFAESRYAPIITAHQDMSTDPLINITGEQVEQIWEEYAKWTDIVAAMGEILDPAHEALTLAKTLDDPDKIGERRAQMYEDIGVENECRVDPSTWEGWDLITNLISENYTRITGPDWEVDKEASVILATQISANKIVEGKHTFTRTVEFNEAYERIQAWSNSAVELQTDLLLIHTTVNNAEGIRWRDRQREAQRVRNTAVQKRLFLSAEFLEIQALFIKTNEIWDIDQRERQREALAQSLEETVGSWEIAGLSWGELDLMAQLDNTTPETA